ncbi:MAG: BamA/TamA family outer membrane protein [Deltaproteobacteria bacterium]|nr:BamA/TamA family outer membrane protein [Deltaproteobacteria bacterium]
MPAKFLAPALCLGQILFLFFFCACGAIIPDVPDMVADQQRSREADELINSDPQGAIPKPNLPPSLSSAATDQVASSQTVIAPYEVTVDFSGEATLADDYKKIADLFSMKETPLSSPQTLNRRLVSSLTQGRDLLKSQGYFEGQAEGKIDYDQSSKKNLVTVLLTPGPQYTLANANIELTKTPPPDDTNGDNLTKKQSITLPLCPAPPGAPPCPAIDLQAAGLKPGAPAVAATVLDAVDRLEGLWKNKGYPLAKITASRFTIDPATKTLHSHIALYPGPFVIIGEPSFSGDSGVKEGYLRNNLTWKAGQNYSQELVDRYRETLLQTGLFKSVEITMNPNDDQSGRRGVLVSLEAAPRRTISGSVNYDSDFGPGVEFSWEHRNLTGWGDKLNVDLPVWGDLQQLGASYQRPYFWGNPRQTLLFDAAALNEKADSYTLTSLSAAAGVERQLNNHLKALVRASLETGSLKEEFDERRQYSIIGLPLSVEWNNANSYLDPTKGMRLSLLLSPYFGHYAEDFKVLKYRFDANWYKLLMGPEKLILAARGTVGAISGSSPSFLPSSLRFFGGGGKSVRGYEYQSIGPKNARGRPTGGGAVGEVGVELRWRFSESMGLTAFIDGGMVYEQPTLSALGKDFLWGGGLGFRYYTPIGPFRLDVATPLTPRAEDEPFQLYLSLGQSF